LFLIQINTFSDKIVSSNTEKPYDMKRIVLSFLFVAYSYGYCLFSQSIDPQRQWSSYRGYYASGILDNANLPERWNGNTGENILWKFRMPGLGNR
jgi:hypothetical protein